MQISPWPLVPRELLVRVFRPGEEATGEAPFRTLRRHAWATAGVRIATRTSGRAAGQVTIFSALNLEAARLARRGELPAAVRLAKQAASLEASKEFAVVAALLAGLSPGLVSSVARGVLPEDLPDADKLWSALRKIAKRTEQVRASGEVRKWRAELLAGRISQVRKTSLVLTTVEGECSIPRWLGSSVHREQVGDDLAVLNDRLGDSSALAVALPALDVEQSEPEPAFDPFARDPRVGVLTMSEMRRISGEPAQPRVLVPVTIEG